MPPTLVDSSTSVPIDPHSSVELEPGHPWPSAYRGSEYSLVHHSGYGGTAVKWEHRDLSLFTAAPDGLRRRFRSLGKSDGYGSFRVTADGEVLTKVPAEDYEYVERAPVDSGWIPVYVGHLDGVLDFDDVESDPPAPNDPRLSVWRGFTFNHGERWSVSTDGTLVWKWRDYRFESAFDHPELVGAYRQCRGTPGRLYVTETGHVWVNLPRDDTQRATEQDVKRAIQEWRSDSTSDGSASLGLVTRRLEATSRDDDPATGHFPIHIGHLRDFDGGRIPKPVVTDSSYFRAVCEYEQVWE